MHSTLPYNKEIKKNSILLLVFYNLLRQFKIVVDKEKQSCLELEQQDN